MTPVASVARMTLPSLADIRQAQLRIDGYALDTPLVRAERLSEHTGADVLLKLESLQPTGSFKVRGAANTLLSMQEDGLAADGVVTYSTGNHGRAVAAMGKRLGIAVTVCVAESTSKAKLDLLRDSGADVRVEGASQDDAAIVAHDLARDRGLNIIEPFDDPRIIAGQGTAGLEIIAQHPSVSTVLVPVSGGGLIAGIALAVKSIDPSVRVVGVTSDRAPAMLDSINAGHPVASRETSTIADSLRGGIGLHNAYTFSAVQQHVDEIVAVSEDQIRDGIRHALLHEGIVIEGAAAVSIAALLHGLVTPEADSSAAVVVTGRSIDDETLRSLLAQQRLPDEACFSAPGGNREHG